MQVVLSLAVAAIAIIAMTIGVYAVNLHFRLREEREESYYRLKNNENADAALTFHRS